jgi:hypothetical protein
VITGKHVPKTVEKSCHQYMTNERYIFFCHKCLNKEARGKTMEGPIADLDSSDSKGLPVEGELMSGTMKKKPA